MVKLDVKKYQKLEMICIIASIFICMMLIFVNIPENINNSNPYIDLSITNDNERLKICVINSTKNDVIKYNPKLVTHKNDRDNHGYGLESIKIIAKKYDGNIYTNSNEHEFTLIMILPLKKF